METTVGQILINGLLPEDMRDYDRVLDKKNVKAIFAELADRYPDKYAEISQKFHTLASDVTSTAGQEASLSLEALRASDKVEGLRGELKKKIQTILDSPLPAEKKNQAIIRTAGEYSDEIEEIGYLSALEKDNPFALQVASGSRGNKLQLRSLMSGDILSVDHKDRPIPIPILSSYSEGLDPAEYWAGSYGARKGVASVKFATPKSGFLGKQLALASHRLVVTIPDCGTQNGIPVKGSDVDNSGAVLALDGQGYKRGAILTPDILREMDDSEIVVRSPMTCEARDGICQRCAGIRERGSFPPIGDNVGVAAAQSVAEPLAQGQLSAKHSGGVIGRVSEKTGMDLVNQLVQVPEQFQGGAAIADTDGRVDSITPAPQGGKFININKVNHWMPSHQKPSVKVGDVVEAGDVISTGIPNPALIVKHKGVGEGRRYFLDQFRDVLTKSGFGTNRRNLELLSRGLINHVRITDPNGPRDTTMDDLVEYDYLVKGWKPRDGSRAYSPSMARNKYLEQPVLHYSVGTRITPRIAKSLQKGNIKTVMAHDEPPPFVPEMTRAMESLAASDDWMVQMGGFHLKKRFMESAHRGRSSELHGTSFIPPLAAGTEFGRVEKGTY